MKIKKFRFAGQQADSVSSSVSRQRELGHKLEFIAYTYEPGATFGRHVHNSEQLTMVLEGKLVFAFDDVEVSLAAGEAVLIPGDIAHGAYVPLDAEVTRTLNVFTPVRDKPPEA